MSKNACKQMLDLVIEMLQVVRDDDVVLWNRIQNILDEIGPTDSYSSALVAKRQINWFKVVPFDEPPPPF